MVAGRVLGASAPDMECAYALQIDADFMVQYPNISILELLLMRTSLNSHYSHAIVVILNSLRISCVQYSESQLLRACHCSSIIKKLPSSDCTVSMKSGTLLISLSYWFSIKMV